MFAISSRPNLGASFIVCPGSGCGGLLRSQSAPPQQASPQVEHEWLCEKGAFAAAQSRDGRQAAGLCAAKMGGTGLEPVAPSLSS
jgi:hypothetical protein